MKLSNDTLNVLKNFSNINSSIFIGKGSDLRTISNAKTVMGVYKTEESFTKPFGVFDLNQLLSTISLFKEPDFQFRDKHVEIKQGSSKIRYGYCAENLITKAPDKDLKLPDTLVEFDLSAEVLKETLRAADVLGAPNWCVKSDKGKLKIVTCDVKDSSVNTFETEVGKCKGDVDIVFNREYLNLLPRDYHVKISSKAISLFEADDVKYFIATENKK